MSEDLKAIRLEVELLRDMMRDLAFRHTAARAQVEALIEALAVEVHLSREIAEGFGIDDLNERRERILEKCYKSDN